MRVNLRKFIIIGVCLICAWLLFSYISLFLVPKVNNKNSIEFQRKLDKLQFQLENELDDSNKLLNRMKQHMNIENYKKAKEFQENNLDIQSEYNFFL